MIGGAASWRGPETSVTIRMFSGALSRGLHKVAAVAAVLLPSVVLAGSGIEPRLVSKGIPHDMLYGVSFEGRQGIAVGDFGLILETTDSGATWTRQAKSVTDLGLFGVVRRQGRCIAGGQSGLILASTDCKQWTAAAPVTKARILTVNVNGSGVAYAVGGFGALLKSADWGSSWQPVPMDWRALTPGGVEPHLYDVHVADDGEVTIVGEFELILRSKDGGAHWITLHQGTRSLFGIKVLENGEAYAVGQEGVILKSIDRGKGWTRLESGTQSILTGIWAQANGQVVASGIYTILYSGNGGKSWQPDSSKLVRSGLHQALAGVEATSGTLNVVAVGSGGAILSIRH